MSKCTGLLSPSPSRLLPTHVYRPLLLRLTFCSTKLWLATIIPSGTLLSSALPFELAQLLLSCQQQNLQIENAENTRGDTAESEIAPQSSSLLLPTVAGICSNSYRTHQVHDSSFDDKVTVSDMSSCLSAYYVLCFIR